MTCPSCQMCPLGEDITKKIKYKGVVINTATIIVLFKPSEITAWEEVEAIDLILPTVRVGRSPQCEICLTQKRLGEPCYVSRRHATFFKWEDRNDYEIMDGSRSDATIANPDSQIISSGSGTAVNGYKLASGEKRLLKNKDKITIVPNQIELVYLRPLVKVSDKIDDLTQPLLKRFWKN